MAIAQQYIDEAAKLAGSGKSQKLADLQSNYDVGVNDYNTQETNLGKQYTANVDTQNRNTALNKNAYNNQVLSRGLGRSSIATTGLTGIDNTNSRILGNLLNTKNEQTNAVETLKNQLRDRLGRDKSAVETDYQTEIMNRALQLQQYADQQAWQQKQYEQQQRAFEEQIRQFNAQQALEQQRLAEQTRQYNATAAAKSNSASSQKANILQYAWQDFADNLNNGNKYWIGDNRSALLDAIGSKEVKKMEDVLLQKENEYYNNAGIVTKPSDAYADDGYM